MSTFTSINPYTQERIEVFAGVSDDALDSGLQAVCAAQRRWRDSALSERSACLRRLAEGLRIRCETLARHMTLEMGKPIREARAEIEKCAWVCEHFAAHGADMLADRLIETDARRSFVRHEPLGVVLAVMPWNFPFWQVFRFAAPALMAGNAGILKHAGNVLRCAHDIEALILDAGVPQDVFRQWPMSHAQVAALLGDPRIAAATLTGSEGAGRTVAECAGRHLKKTVLELGGNNAFIVLADADLEHAVKTAVTARFQNSGQSCIAAKRFLVEKPIYADFLAAFTARVAALNCGDPLNEDTEMGPLARAEFAQQLQRQVDDSVQAGAEVILGGGHEGAFFQPTVMVAVRPEMPVMREETFGPVAPVMCVDDVDHAIRVASDTRFGLGVSVCTGDPERILAQLDRFADGAVFINDLVKSDPRLPFGGTGISGHGRELCSDGLLEFINRKTVYLR